MHTRHFEIDAGQLIDIANLLTECEDSTAIIEAYKHQFAEKEDEINALKAQLAEVNGKLKAKADDCLTLTAKVGKLTNRLTLTEDELNIVETLRDTARSLCRYRGMKSVRISVDICKNLADLLNRAAETIIGKGDI